MPEDPPFPGFTSPNYTQTPNDLFDQLLRPGQLTEAELRVLLYIVRRTFGFGKDADAISLTQLTDGITTRDGRRLDWGAGLSRPGATKAVKGLERKGMIVVTRSRDARGDAINTYALRWADRDTDPRRQGVNSVNPPGNNGNPPSKPPEPSPGNSVNPQENVPIQSEQEGTGPALAAVLAVYGGAWATLQPQAERLCRARGWTPAQLAEQLAACRAVGLRAKLRALAGE